MVSKKVKVFVLLVIVGLLSACASPATPASQATEVVVLPTETEAPTATSAPIATDTSVPVAESSPTAEAAPAGAAISFANDILPLLESRCVNCHGGDRIEEGLILKTFADLMKGSEDGVVVIPGDAEHSLLAELVIEQKMPKRGPKLTPTQVQLIVDWINQGALDN
jgi:hypothetical protein